MNAVELFEDFGDLDGLADQLGAEDSAARRVAVMALADTADPAAVPLLISALRDPAAEVRLQAASALGEFDGPAVAAALAAARADPDPAVGQAAAQSVGSLKEPGAA